MPRKVAQIILDCEHGGMSDIYSDFSLSWGVKDKV